MSSAQTQDIPIEAVTEVAEVNPRMRLDTSRVAEFARLYCDGGKSDTWNPAALPPLIVVVSDGEHILADGRHRLAALRKIGAETVPVVLIPARDDPSVGTDRERVLRTAYLVAVETAAREGLPLTAPERRAACAELRRLGLSTEETARRVGVSRRTVERAVRPATDDVPAAGGYMAADADTLMRRLVGGLDAAWRARGLGEKLIADRGAERLAAALEARHGRREGAVWAGRLREWAAGAERRLSRGTGGEAKP